MCCSFDLIQENNTFEITISSGAIKDKPITIDEETMKKFEEDIKMVRVHLLKHMINPILDLFVTFTSAKIIWKKLEVKYGADDARGKKYVVGEWLRF